MQLVDSETIEQMDNNTGKWLVDFMKERDAELEEKLAFQEKKFEELLERKLKDGIEEVKQSMIRETINFPGGQRIPARLSQGDSVQSGKTSTSLIANAL